ncbi:ferredoxin--NADP reductase [Paeniglutamicibacter gangotriensis]|uniref:Nitric oxide dioxygenase n=1 Tax=Paeniglutamicibacter gangotriensis Lz1y TaxID=1276920 RepID=M7MUS8_9MICC|nr:ferredoxin--NADP reductase [Paeniglutamicibacter gangotriensis]EMR00203.1 nitric oxide dioxygenase [Paeniglutamicibacter gangotriensis Lz1y]
MTSTVSSPRITALQTRVVEVIRETADAHTLVLEPAAEQSESFRYRPGQFLTLRIPSDRDQDAARCYSLCSSPEQDERLKITIKRTRDGYASNWICDNVEAGHVLEVLKPAGTFVPSTLDTDFLLFAAGSGVTPVMSILKSALIAGSGTVTLIYANRDEQSVIFKDELVALTKAYPGRLHVIHWLETVQGIPDLASMTALAQPYAQREAFICGPGPFMDCIEKALEIVGTAPERIHIERFVSLDADPFAPVEPLNHEADGETATIEVELDGNTSNLAWPPGNKLLDVLLNAGIDAPFSCREGACSACTCILLEGKVEMERNEVLEEQDLEEGLILACQAKAVSPHVRISYEG